MLYKAPSAPHHEPRRSQDCGMVNTIEVVAGNWGSGSAVSAQAVRRVMGGPPERNKIATKYK